MNSSVELDSKFISPNIPAKSPVPEPFTTVRLNLITYFTIGLIALLICYFIKSAQE